jgi:hypothetical protein
MNFDFEIETIQDFFPSLKIKVAGYRPHRPAPFASCHDSAAYSDSGDDAEFEDYRIYLTIADGLEIDITHDFETLSEENRDNIFKKIEEQIWIEGQMKSKERI